MPEKDDLEHEHELRVLLERSVPRLPAPEERLRRVRERAARSRRRCRVAGTGAAAVTGLVMAGTLLPGFLRGGPGDGAPPASPAPTVSATGTPTGREVRFPDLSDLTLRLPPGWQALAVPGDPASDNLPRGFVADQRIPVRALRPGGVLVSLDLKKFGGLHTKTRNPPELNALDKPTVRCRQVQGTEEYGALLAGPDPGADVGIQVSVCVAGAGASSRIVDDVRDMIAGAHHPAPRPGPEPSKAPPAHEN